MSFIFPGFLWALLLLAIPIIIHLFNFRRYKKVYFTNVRFLREVQEQTAAKSNLKHYLVLLSRLLALAFLIFAFAQPFIPTSEETPLSDQHSASIYIDNSFSMAAVSEDVSLLELARKKAREIVQAFPDQARIQVLTNERSAGQYRFLSPDQALAAIDEIEISPQQAKLNEIIAFSQQSADYSKNNRFFFLSDFQRNAFELPEDTFANAYFIPIQAVREQNLYIDSAWINSPVVFENQSLELMVNIVNDGEQDISASSVQLISGSQNLALSDFEVKAGESITDTLIFRPKKSGWLGLELQIEDYPITFDDAYFLAIKVSESLKVLGIHEKESSDYLSALFDDSERFIWESKSQGALNYEGFSDFSLIVLDNLSNISSGLAYALQAYVEKGGNVILFPAAEADIASVNEFLKLFNASAIDEYEKDNKIELSRLNEKASVWEDIFESVPENLALPKVKSRFSITGSTKSREEILLSFRDGKSYVSKFPYQSGALYFVASPLGEKYSDFPVHALFVPFLYKVAISGGYAQNIAHKIDTKSPILVQGVSASSEEVMRLKSGEMEFIPGQKTLGNDLLLDIGTDIRSAGLYELLRQEQKKEAIIALNYNRSESEMDFLSNADLKTEAENYNFKIIDNYKAGLTNIVQQLDSGIALWKLCITFALAFLMIEALLLRFWPS
ncbi:MAG: BatA domain-containing protein [Chitinophagales bacterium]